MRQSLLLHPRRALLLQREVHLDNSTYRPLIKQLLEMLGGEPEESDPNREQ